MIKTLVALRFRALLAGMTRRDDKKKGKKKRGAGSMVAIGLLYLYLAVLIIGVMCYIFYTLAGAYHMLGLDWLYFAMAGLMGLGFAVIGSAFTTQSQLYEAKDNEMLLSMPVTPRAILISRLLPLLVLNLVYAGVIMLPATVMYAVLVSFSIGNVLMQLLGLIIVCFLAQTLSCVLGWLLHLLLSKVNKSVASVLYLVAFLGVYFYIYTQAGDILQNMAASGEAIAKTLQTWVWPLYALGQGCLGSIVHMLGFLLLTAVLFGAVCLLLSHTFLATVTSKRSARRRKKLELGRGREMSPRQAVTWKEWRKFLSSPMYLINMGMGVILMVALPIAGLFLRGTILGFLEELDFLRPWVPILIWAMMSFLISTACVSTPSVSLEGKNIWVLKSMPIAPKDILMGKLSLHCQLTVPVAALATLVLTVAYGCGILESALVILACGLFAAFSGLFGLWAGLQWAKLDYISEAYPCKQSVAIVVAMFGVMGVPLVFGVAYVALARFLPPAAFLGIYSLLLLAACFGLYRVIITWGAKEWDALA